jgi:hypothetical protein
VFHYKKIEKKNKYIQYKNGTLKMEKANITKLNLEKTENIHCVKEEFIDTPRNSNNKSLYTLKTLNNILNNDNKNTNHNETSNYSKKCEEQQVIKDIPVIEEKQVIEDIPEIEEQQVIEDILVYEKNEIYVYKTYSCWCCCCWC